MNTYKVTGQFELEVTADSHTEAIRFAVADLSTVCKEYPDTVSVEFNIEASVIKRG